MKDKTSLPRAQLVFLAREGGPPQGLWNHEVLQCFWEGLDQQTGDGRSPSGYVHLRQPVSRMTQGDWRWRAELHGSETGAERE